MVVTRESPPGRASRAGPARKGRAGPSPGAPTARRMGVSNGCGHGRSRRARLVAVSCRVAARWRAPERESPGPPPDDPALRCGTDAFDLRALAYRLTRDRSGAGEGQQRWGYSPSHLLIAAMTTLITIVLATPPIRLTTGAADRSQQTGARGRWSRILILEPPSYQPPPSSSVMLVGMPLHQRFERLHAITSSITKGSRRSGPPATRWVGRSAPSSNC